jgi:heme/copper-type cytochrome/quinol oxidase subunit 1
VPAAWVTRPLHVDEESLCEYMMWGAGHVLQFANTALLLCVTYLIGRITLGETPLPARLFKVMLLLLVAGASAGPLFYAGFEGGDPTQRYLFTALYRYILPLPATVVCVSVVMLLVRRREHLWDGAPEVAGLATALLLFGIGGVIGFFESSVDTRTPAHYHAMLIAVTLVFMTAYFALFLPLLGRRTPRRRLRTAMYLTLGRGQLLHTLGLFVAGALGVARKTAGAAQDLDSPDKVFFMPVMGLGGVIAVVGGIIFIVLAGKLLLAKRSASVTATAPSGGEHR